MVPDLPNGCPVRTAPPKSPNTARFPSLVRQPGVMMMYLERKMFSGFTSMWTWFCDTLRNRQRTHPDWCRCCSAPAMSIHRARQYETLQIRMEAVHLTVLGLSRMFPQQGASPSISVPRTSPLRRRMEKGGHV